MLLKGYRRHRKAGFHTVQRVDKSNVSHTDVDDLYTTGVLNTLI